jgi:hypothetical protein
VFACRQPEKDCREALAGILFRSFTMVGSQVGKGKFKLVAAGILLRM